METVHRTVGRALRRAALFDSSPAEYKPTPPRWETTERKSFVFLHTYIRGQKKDTHFAFEVRVLEAAACRWWRWRRSARGLTNSPPDCWSRAAARRPVRRRALRTQTDPAPPGDGEAGKFFYISTHVFAGIKDAHPAFEVRVLGAAASLGGDGGGLPAD